MELWQVLLASLLGSVVTGLVTWGGVRSDIKTLFKNDERHDREINAVDERVDRILERGP